MSKQLSSDAQARSEEHPFYVLPNFEVVGSTTREQSGVEVIIYSPVLQSVTEVPAWIDYTIAQGDNETTTWLQTSINAVVESGEGSADDYQIGPYPPYLFDLDDNGNEIISQGPGPFSPLWQMSPPPFRPGSINYNMLDFDWAEQGFTMLNETRVAHYSRMMVLDELRNVQELVMTNEDHNAMHAERVQNGDATDPHTVYMVPVFEDPFNKNSPLVGFLSAVFSWDRYVDGLLPEGVEGIICVVQNTCGQAITYELVGNHVSRTLQRDHRCLRKSNHWKLMHFFSCALSSNK